MATFEELRSIAMALPQTTQVEGDPLFLVAGKQFVWTWRERVHPKKTKVPRPEVLAVRVPDQQDKAALISSDPTVFFTESHYDGYPIVLVRLPQIGLPALTEVVQDSWRCVAPPELTGTA
ncbi:MmcQ/YjbR family DNA-binding protein [Angustibacter sp. McL0619]|uniref:MmcQ/YjbR family DNA-binding protein n=1 Tax=Angustibacter sp. McL0619 TaxID=3415676 RepID=UPI003CF652E4